MSGGGAKKKRLLILTSASGAGHDTHAQAAKDWCGRIYGEAVEVRIEHLLEDSHAICRMGVDFYNLIQRKAPWFHHIYYNLLECPLALQSGAVGPGREYCARLFREAVPDAILSVHDCLNRGYFELARKVVGQQVRCATFCTEFGGGYGYSRNWVNVRADFHFARTQDAADAAMGLGMEANRTVVSGHWAPVAFYETSFDESGRRDYLARVHGLDPDRFTLLLSTGGSGAQNHADLLRALRPLGARIQVVALCGRAESDRTWLRGWAEREVEYPVRVLSFTREMPQLLQACSAVVARAGATTAGEALLSTCPIIFNTLGGIMPQEMPTWRYYEARGMGFKIHRPAGLSDIIRCWLDKPEEWKALKERMSAHRDAVTPERALRLLLD